jgi:uncharacterized protein (UPF0332 family)
MEQKLRVIRAWLALADEKIVVAQKLIELGYFDDAASRAYYGMFYAAKAALLSLDIDPKSHAGVLNQFSQHFIKTGQLDKQYGRILALVRQVRETSDYNPETSVSQADVETIMAEAQTFVERIKDYLSLS